MQTIDFQDGERSLVGKYIALEGLLFYPLQDVTLGCIRVHYKSPQIKLQKSLIALFPVRLLQFFRGRVDYVFAAKGLGNEMRFLVRLIYLFKSFGCDSTSVLERIGDFVEHGRYQFNRLNHIDVDVEVGRKHSLPLCDLLLLFQEPLGEELFGSHCRT